eukprot:m51a1_g7888 putative zinc finger CCCH domain-containing protein (413) ;mRNA; r:75373-76807
MPPKKSSGPSAKSVQKVKDKIVEDKTFGLKNKNKSKKVQQYVQNVKTVVQKSGPRKTDEEKAKEKALEKKRLEKKLEEEKKKELALLMRPGIVQPKVPPGVDPKSFVCEFWKQGCCQKGDKCKYAHDLGVTRRAQKIDLYTDRRGAGEGAEGEDTIDSWDQRTLEQVVDTKRGSENKNLKTTIVCKHFLEALDTRKYGWFWECPNGDKCQYVHALPPGFVLKPREVKTAPDPYEDLPGIEDEIEKERAKIRGGEPVTKESFMRWKEEKLKKREAAQKKAADEKRAAVAAGRTVLLSGRELLVYKPTLFVDDEEAANSDDLVRQKDEEYDAELNAEDSAAAAADAPAAAAADEDVGDVEADLFVDDDDEEDEDEDEEQEEGEEQHEGDEEQHEEEQHEEQQQHEEEGSQAPQQ